jgi:hypothetical protein
MWKGEGKAMLFFWLGLFLLTFLAGTIAVLVKGAGH